MGSDSLAFDANGNTTTDQNGRTLVYDAWNRLVEAKSGSTSLIRYEYGGLTRRIEEGSTDQFFSAAWQVLEERVANVVTASYAWSPVYVDAMIARDRDSDANGSLDERLYALQDANFNMTAVVDTSGTVVERYLLNPYGKRIVLDGSFVAISGNSSTVSCNYGHQGGKYDSLLMNHMLFRYRVYDVETMRWMQQDPLGYVDGLNLAAAYGLSPATRRDPEGLTHDDEFWEMVAAFENEGMDYRDAYFRAENEIYWRNNPPLPPEVDEKTSRILEEQAAKERSARNAIAAREYLMSACSWVVTPYFRFSYSGGHVDDGFYESPEPSLSKWLYYEYGVYIEPAGAPAGFARTSGVNIDEIGSFIGGTASAIANYLWRPGQLAFGFEGDAVYGIGLEGGAGIVLDLWNPRKSGIYGTGGPAVGKNFGIAGGAVFFPGGEVRGNSVQVDVNAKFVSGVAGTTTDGTAVYGGSMGLGVGASVSYTKTVTYTLEDAWNDIKRLFR